METLNATTVYLSIQGMKTPDCAFRIYNALMLIRGVVRVGIVMEKGLVAAAYRDADVSPDMLVRAVEALTCNGKRLYRAEVKIVSSPQGATFS
jgi:copper chaperone CopZ